MTLFERIIARQIPAKIAYEDDQVLALHDIQPQAPVHVLVIPRQPITQLSEASEEHQDLLGHLLLHKHTLFDNLSRRDNKVWVKVKGFSRLP